MKTVKEILEHLENEIYTPNSLSKIDGFLECYKLFNNEEPCMYGTHEPTTEGKPFKYFMEWFNGNNIKDGDWVKFTDDNGSHVIILEGGNVVYVENEDGFALYKIKNLIAKSKKLMDDYNIYEVLNEFEVERLGLLKMTENEEK